MNTYPFSPTGYDISDLQSKMQGKAERYEVDALRSDVGRLECSLRELSSVVDGLRAELASAQATINSLFSLVGGEGD